MTLIKFENAHNYLDTLDIPRLDEYESNVIIDRIDFTDQENDGSIEWRNDGVYLIINGNYQKGFMFNKNYRISDYGNPRFHLFECSVIQNFIDQGIMSRYYFWSNSDLVTVTQRGSNIEYENQSLNLCSKCRQILHERNLPRITNTEDFHSLLDLNDTEIENNDTETDTDIFNRPINWRRISRAYREEQNYTCEECGFGGDDLDSNYDKRFIHTHHINSNELLNTHRDNLKAVCVLCHYKQDEHHQSNFEKRRMKRELINFVRKYRNRLIEIENLYVEEFIRENEI